MDELREQRREITSIILRSLPHTGKIRPRHDGDWTPVGAKNGGPTRGREAGRADEDFVEGLYVGDAIRFFLDAKRAGGRSERIHCKYRKKLDLFQQWAAAHVEGEGAVDAPPPGSAPARWRGTWST